MPFNIALSGIRSANDDLRITGNNIANASTTGFKESRAEFGDVYALSIGSGSAVGSGVRVQDVAQQFTQGNISFTDNVLDLAISGNGFFVTDLNGDETYTRSGTFGLDSDGYVTNNVNARLQGFVADANGNLSSLPSDIQISARNLQPELTSFVETEVNVDSRELAPQTAFIISAARIADLEAGGDIDIGITNPLNNESTVRIANAAAPADTATTIAAQLDLVTGVDSVVNAAGDVEIILTEGYSLTNNPTVAAATALTESQTTELSELGFDPNNSNTYSHSTAVTIFDSLGNPHVLQKFFIKQPYDPSAGSGTIANHWQMVVQVDGQNVGPDVAGVPSLAAYDLYFNNRGELDEVTTGDIDITNWTPLDANGNTIGAVGPNGSDFRISLTNSTQISGDFEVRTAEQNGTTTGRLSGLTIDDTGNIFARYTNGQNRILAQVALADFSNAQGLEPIGDSSWAETSVSGSPVIGEAGTASLGLIQSGALEESNVDLSEQLVNLIIAQRNFQASAKTIETADQTTQTIINLR